MRLARIRAWIVAILALALGAFRAPAQTQDDLFNDNIVHEVRLTIASSDWQTLKKDYLSNTYYPCDFTWVYQGRRTTLLDIGIRSRGTGSRSPVKPSLRVDFDRFEEKQDLFGLKSLILRANTQDPSMLHERLSMLVFRRMGVPGSREAHTRLYVNDEYIGLYTIVESVDKDFLKRNFNEKEGYLYKYDYPAGAEPYYFEYKGSNPALYSPLPFKPETHELDPDPKPIVDMIRTINQSSDTDFSQAVAQYLDLRLFLVHVAVESLLSDQDGILGDFGMNNFYFYRFWGKTLSRFIAWDKSNAFAGLNGSIWHNTSQNVLMKRALAVPELRTAYLEALAKCVSLAGGENGWLAQEIEREYNQIRQAAYDDRNKQKQDPKTGLLTSSSNQDFEEAVNFLRLYARERGNYILNELAAGGYSVPRLSSGGAVNAATFSGAVLAPGSLISLFGLGIGNVTAAASALPLPTELAQVAVQINRVAAPLLFVSPGQVNVQLPWEISPGTATITVSVQGVASNSISANVGSVSPGVFVAVHADGSPITASNPASAGEVIVVYATGLGAVTGSPVTGQGAPSDPPATTLEPATVTIGNVPAGVEFSGLTPGFVGLYQVNVRLAGGTPADSRTSLVLSIGGQTAPPYFLATR